MVRTPARGHAGAMTTTPPDAPTGTAPDPGDGGPRATRDQVRDLGRLRRSRTDRKVAGVAGGLARHLDIDPVILRVAFVVLVFFGGAGLLLYGACWLLVPEEGSDSAPISLDERSRTVALAIVGGLAVVALIGDSWGFFGFPWPLAIIAVVALLILTRRGVSGPGTPVPGAGVPAWSRPAGPAPTYAAPTHTSPTYAGPAYAGPTYPATPGYAVPATPRNPRRRGPVLFWFTLALITLALGVLGIVDLAGAPVADPAYPALAVGLTGAMLLVGAFWGRAGGLILLGLVSSFALTGATVAGQFDGETVHEKPLTAAAVQDSYDIGMGELVLDLSKVADPQSLDGRQIHLEAGIGRIEVIVPRGVDIDASGRVGGPGHVVLFGDDLGGVDTTLERRRDGGTDAALLTIDAELGIGEIEVRLAAPVPAPAPAVPNTPDHANTPNTPTTPNGHSRRSHR